MNKIRLVLHALVLLPFGFLGYLVGLCLRGYEAGKSQAMKVEL